MIKVTVWNENVEERGLDAFPHPEEMWPNDRAWYLKTAEEIRLIHPEGIHGTLKALLEEDEELQVRTVTLDMPECGLTEEILDDTDVLIWWAHVAHDWVADEIAKRVQQHVLRGMGFISLHSAHRCKPMQLLLGTSFSVQWRENDRARVWCTCPTHPIAKGIPPSFELPEEEMYGEYFDIPKPEDVVFTSWFAGGELVRSGCTWTRGYGKMFYFQPGHETQGSYHIPEVRQVIRNAVHWTAPIIRREKIESPHAQISAEARLAQK